jgi:two-component system phosphate regulon sensor histidine kinase PhoR
MIRFGLRERMAVTALAASAAALVAVLLLVGPRLRERTLEHRKDALLAEARLMAHVVEEPLLRGAGPEALDPIVDAAAREVRARVTIIGLDGRVLADTALSGPDLLKMENHANRPEVREVLASGIGSSVRHSATVDQDLLYAAVPVRGKGRLLGISRVAFSLKDVQEQADDLRRSVAVALALAFAVTALLAIPLASPLVGPLRAVMESARRFSAGDLSARARVSRTDEVGELARILDHSADQLQGRLTEIARERARTESVLAAMQSGLLAVDHQGVVLLANPVLRTALEMPEPVGRHYVEVIRHPEVSRVVEEVLRTGQPRAAEVQLHRLRREYAVSASPFPGTEGMPQGAVATFEEVTERRRVDKIRRDFVANASHELRTPLTSIRGFVEALEDGAIDDAATGRRFLEKIRANADRMAALVSDLLELSRLEAGERPPQWESLLAGDLLEEVAGALSELARNRGIEVVCGAADAGAVEADADRLRRILENLLENALKYTPEGGRVEITARQEDGRVAFEVADDGPGIAAEHLPRIFERFYRVDKARSRELGGTGLGLSIVKHLAESMGGSVTVDSAPGRGSRFVLRLPRRSRPRAAPDGRP